MISSIFEKSVQQFNKIFYLYPYNNHLNPFLDSMPHSASRMSPEGRVSFYRQSVDTIHRIDASVVSISTHIHTCDSDEENIRLHYVEKFQ